MVKIFINISGSDLIPNPMHAAKKNKKKTEEEDMVEPSLGQAIIHPKPRISTMTLNYYYRV